MLKDIFLSFGGNPNHSQSLKYSSSPNWKQGSFKNLLPTRMNPEGVSFWKIGREFLRNHPDRRPRRSIPNLAVDVESFSKLPGDAFIWLGHSTILLRIDSMNILVDPVFSRRASPFGIAGPLAFSADHYYGIPDLPPIDLVLITHDHYDHLDMHVIRALKHRTTKFIAPLGVAPHLIRWGIGPDRITELDWWDEYKLGLGITITAVPARHFSGRAVNLRNQSLWAGFALQGSRNKVLLGSDSGYGPHFSEIGERFSGFDLAFLECGQYNSYWPSIHMFPEQTVQAALDARAAVFVPIHWGRFSLSMHPWYEPVERAIVQAEKSEANILVPRIGQIVTLGSAKMNEPWWSFGHGQ